MSLSKTLVHGSIIKTIAHRSFHYTVVVDFYPHGHRGVFVTSSKSIPPWQGAPWTWSHVYNHEYNHFYASVLEPTSQSLWVADKARPRICLFPLPSSDDPRVIHVSDLDMLAVQLMDLGESDIKYKVEAAKTDQEKSK